MPLARPPIAPASLTRRQALWALSALAAPSWAAAAYDPLALPPAPLPPPLDLSFEDAARRRDIPFRVYLPVSTAPSPVLLFSHGLGGSRGGGSGYLGAHWAARGHTLVAMQHRGSDEDVWKGQPRWQVVSALKRAANAQNLKLRVEDVHATLDQLARWQATPGHALAGRLDLARVGMSGHSFGAQTTQAVSGQSFPLAWGRGFTDSRIAAALALSPDAPAWGGAAAAFGAVSIPWLLMTGTKDTGQVGHATPASRQAVYPALPPGGKYELVLDGAGPRSVLQPADRWQRK